MNKISSFEHSFAVVKNALGTPATRNALSTPATRKPAIPKDREPKLHQKSKKHNPFSEDGVQSKTDATDKQLSRRKLWKSMIMMLGSFIERSPEAKDWKRSELRDFISQMEICLEIKPGKLSLQQYGNLIIKLDAIAPFKDGELTKDLETLDQVIQAYGGKLAQQDKKI